MVFSTEVVTDSEVFQNLLPAILANTERVVFDVRGRNATADYSAYDGAVQIRWNDSHNWGGLDINQLVNARSTALGLPALPEIGITGESLNVLFEDASIHGKITVDVIYYDRLI